MPHDDVRQYLESITPSPGDIDDFVAKHPGPDGQHPHHGWTYDSELGFVHTKTIRPEIGVGGTTVFYSYEGDGARRVIHQADRSCRIHTFGDSFTHCDQVNDGETWQEFLAAHLQEPIRNYGVSGGSVYQAYRRMKKVHREGEHIAPYVIINIYSQDHYRNLWSYDRLRHPRPHLRVNVARRACTEHETATPTEQDLYKLCDTNFLDEQYRDDPMVHMALARKGRPENQSHYLEQICNDFGVPVPPGCEDEIEQRLDRAHTEAALFSTQRVVEMAERFCRETGKKLMFILSYQHEPLIEALQEGFRFDEGFVDWLKRRDCPVVDMCEKFDEAWRRSRLGLDQFLDPYYIGHHTPAGNFFTAWSIKDTLVGWLDPKSSPHE